MDIKATLGWLGTRGHRVIREDLALLVNLDLQVSRVQQGDPESLDWTVVLEPPGLPEHPAQVDPLVHLAHMLV